MRAESGRELGMVVPEHDREQLGQRTGVLDAGRSAADDDEREEAPPLLVAVGLACALEAREHVVSQAHRVAERLERERRLRHGVVPEPVGLAPGREDEVVGRDLGAIARADRPPGEIDVRDERLPHAHVARVAEHGAERIRDVRRIEQRRRDLVEQRREGVVALPVDEQHVDVAAVELPRARQPAESTADDHDSGASACHGGILARSTRTGISFRLATMSRLQEQRRGA